MEIRVTLNGREITTEVRPDQSLFSFCRAQGAKSVKCGCETSNCGLCTVLLDDKPVLSCSVPMARVDGHTITTLEGCGRDRELLATCIAEEGGEQCGFCSPGLEMAVLALDRTFPNADETTIRRELDNNLCRCTGYASQVRAVKRFLARHGNNGNLPAREVPNDAVSQDGITRSRVGHSLVKKDAESLLAGRPVYTDDLAPQDALVVKLVRSRHAHARIRSIDTSKALAVPGVVAVYTHEDVPRNRFTLAGQSYPEPSHYDTLILDDTMRYVGDEVAIVVALSESAAAEGVRLVKVDYEVLPAIIDVEDALDADVVIHDEDDWLSGSDPSGDPKRNLIGRAETTHGDLDAAFAEADVVIEQRYRTQAARQTMMETFRTYAYVDEMGRLTVVSSTQVPFHIRRQVALALGIPKSQVRVIKPRVGGGFGAKQSGCTEVFAAFAAWKLGRPCSCRYSREETQAYSNSRHEVIMDVRLGAKNDGTIVAIDLQALSNGGAYAYHGTTTAGLIGCKTLPVYNRALASRFTYEVAYTNTMPGGAFRGYGATQGCFAVESAVNELADKLGRDPIDLRLQNLVESGETLWQFDEQTLAGWRGRECVERARDMMNWQNRPLREDLGDRVRGLGMAVSMQGSGIAHVDIANVDIRLEDDGFYVLSIGATDVGTGADTILAQMAAEGLGCDVDRIVTKGVDTDTSPFDTGAYASSGTYVTGGAVINAVADLRRQICEQAAAWWDVDVKRVQFADGRVWSEDSSGATTNEMTVADMANRLIGAGLQQGMLCGHGTNSSPVSPPPFIVGIAEVEVDKATGLVRLTDYASVVDCGTVVNPNLARVQTEGGLVQGIGMALTEEISYDDKGRLRTSSLMQYKIPSRSDVPSPRVEFMPSFEPTGPFGAKSIGEVVINTPSPAIASAVAHAVGRQVRSLPITPDKVLLGEDADTTN